MGRFDPRGRSPAVRGGSVREKRSIASTRSSRLSGSSRHANAPFDLARATVLRSGKPIKATTGPACRRVALEPLGPCFEHRYIPDCQNVFGRELATSLRGGVGCPRPGRRPARRDSRRRAQASATAWASSPFELATSSRKALRLPGAGSGLGGRRAAAPRAAAAPRRRWLPRAPGRPARNSVRALRSGCTGRRRESARRSRLAGPASSRHSRIARNRQASRCRCMTISRGDERLRTAGAVARRGNRCE